MPVAKPYHHGALREGALAEGLKLLAETGVTKFSLREVARRLGVTATALYHHFPDKEDLLAALAYHGLEQFEETIVRAAASEGDVLSAMGAAYIRFFLEHPYYMDLLFRPATKSDERVRSIWGSTFHRIELTLQERGVDVSEAPYYGVWLWSGVHGLAGMLRDRILGNPEACGPDAPGVFLLYPDQLLQKVIPLVGRVIGREQNSPRN